MGAKKEKPYKVVAAFDTETTNIKIGNKWHAFVVCYQFNSLHNVDLKTYEPGNAEKVYIYKSKHEALRFIKTCIDLAGNSYIPVICGYNLIFDLQTLFYDLATNYDLKVNAQSSTNVYTLDIMGADDMPILRFWDTFHLEMSGLEAMGETAGLYKLNGSWDYSLIRTPETPLTEAEIAYATRDVQVIPAYLRYLLEANEWLEPEMLGCRVITKTSLVRQMAKNEIAPLKVKLFNGRSINLFSLFVLDCKEALPHCYYDYALEKACFRGGLTFTSAKYASVVVKNVVSLDAVSMHHLHINGHYLPKQFRPCNKRQLQDLITSVLSTTKQQLLNNYHRPFSCAFHMRIRFKNLRLKPNTAFSEYGIAIIPRGKFGFSLAGSAEYGRNDSAQAAEAAARLSGWRDWARNARFAFGKLYEAEECILHICEWELWAISRVYIWDSIDSILGEGACKFELPPDYVTLQSNLLFKRKQDMKFINKNYSEGSEFKLNIPESIPKGVTNGLLAGTLSNDFVAAYYSSTVKGMFNS